MSTFVMETTTTRVEVVHRGKFGRVVFYREVDYFGDVQNLRAAREEAQRLSAFMQANPDSPAPLEAGWTWRT